jgi:hypothetical protein
MKSSNIKFAIGFLVFFALYLSYNIPVIKIQKIVQITSTGLALLGMIYIFRKEETKRWQNLTLIVLLAATFVGYCIVK